MPSVVNATALLMAAKSIHREWNAAARWRLQDTARSVMNYGSKTHRVSACLRNRLGGSNVVVSTTKSGKTQLGGLMICGAHHVCPVCHHRKMSSEWAIVSRIVSHHMKNDGGGLIVSATLTLPHHLHESLDDVLARLESVWTAMQSKPVWQKLKAELGIVGYVRRLELTWGANGWHPHFHLQFLCAWATTNIVDRTRHHSRENAEACVRDAWAEASLKADVCINRNAQAAATIVASLDADKAVAYVLKNMAYGDKTNSLTPMDLLRVAQQSDDPAAVRTARQLFREYAEAIKGKHTVTYSGSARKIKAEVQEDTKAEMADPIAEPLGRISPHAWAAIRISRLRDVLVTVRTREDLLAVVGYAAWLPGHAELPPGWLTLTSANKSVIGIKAGAISPAPITEQ